MTESNEKNWSVIRTYLQFGIETTLKRGRAIVMGRHPSADEGRLDDRDRISPERLK